MARRAAKVEQAAPSALAVRTEEQPWTEDEVAEIRAVLLADVDRLRTELAAVDAEIAYAMIRQCRPRRIVEIGSGQSTLLLLEALRANERDGVFGEILACEPYPDDYVREAAADPETGKPGASHLSFVSTSPDHLPFR